MTNTQPAWLTQVAAADERLEKARKMMGAAMEAAADERAHIIARAVENAGRGGRQTVADALGVTVGQVDKAIARARTAAPTHLPSAEETLRLLYAAELRSLAPLTSAQWRAVATLVRSLVIDASWIETGPGPLLADEYAEAAEDGDAPADPGLVETVAAWSRLQALAVIDTIHRDATADLPATT